MILAIAAVFMVECIKADDRYSVFTSVVTDSISPNSESIRPGQSDRLLKLLVIFSCFMKTESHYDLRILFVQRTDFPFRDIVHSVSSFNILVL